VTRDEVLYLAVALPVIAYVWLTAGYFEAAALTFWPRRWGFLGKEVMGESANAFLRDGAGMGRKPIG
jgi:hypothetical protein